MNHGFHMSEKNRVGQPKTKEWAVACEATVATEFPSWDVIASFEVFALKGASAEHERRTDAKLCLRKLAQVFDLDAEKLFQQFTAILPMAAAIQRQGGLENRQAWTTALNRVQARQSQQKKWPSTELRQAG